MVVVVVVVVLVVVVDVVAGGSRRWPRHRCGSDRPGGVEDRHACDEEQGGTEYAGDSLHHRNSSGATGQSMAEPPWQPARSAWSDDPIDKI